MPGDSRSESSSSPEVPSKRLETITQRHGFERPDNVSQEYSDFKDKMKNLYSLMKNNKLERTEFTEIYKERIQTAAEAIMELAPTLSKDQIYKDLESRSSQAQKEIYSPQKERRSSERKRTFGET